MTSVICTDPWFPYLKKSYSFISHVCIIRGNFSKRFMYVHRDRRKRAKSTLYSKILSPRCAIKISRSWRKAGKGKNWCKRGSKCQHCEKESLFSCALRSLISERLRHSPRSKIFGNDRRDERNVTLFPCKTRCSLRNTFWRFVLSLAVFCCR